MKRLVLALGILLVASPLLAQNSPSKSEHRIDAMAAYLVRQLQLYGRSVTIDGDAPDSYLLGPSAWAGATGASQTGGNLYAAGGMGSRLFTVQNRALFIGGSTLTFTVNGGAAVVLTEGGAPGFVCAAAASDAECATNAAASINTSVAGVYAYVDGTNVLLNKDDMTFTLVIASSVPGGILATSGTNGTLSLISPSIVGALLLPDGTVAAPALAFTTEPGLGLYRIGATQAGWAVAGNLIHSYDTNGLNVDQGNLRLGTDLISGQILTTFDGTVGVDDYISLRPDMDVVAGDAIAALGDNAATWLRLYGGGVLRQGDADAAAPEMQYFEAQNVLTGTANTAGASRFIDGSRGTGSADGGAIYLRTAPAGAAGGNQNALENTLVVGGNGLVGVQIVPAIDLAITDADTGIDVPAAGEVDLRTNGATPLAVTSTAATMPATVNLNWASAVGIVGPAANYVEINNGTIGSSALRFNANGTITGNAVAALTLDAVGTHTSDGTTITVTTTVAHALVPGQYITLAGWTWLGGGGGAVNVTGLVVATPTTLTFTMRPGDWAGGVCPPAATNPTVVGTATPLGELSLVASDGVLRHGAADAAAPAIQYDKVQNVLNGTPNAAGVHRYIDGSQGTGGVDGGSTIFRNAPGGVAGANQNPLTSSFSVGAAGLYYYRKSFHFTEFVQGDGYNIYMPTAVNSPVIYSANTGQGFTAAGNANGATATAAWQYNATNQIELNNGTKGSTALLLNANGTITGNAVAPVATATRACDGAGNATLTTAAHALVVGQPVVVAGVGVAAYNGSFVVVTVPSTTSITYACGCGAEASTPDVAGTVTAQSLVKINNKVAYGVTTGITAVNPGAQGDGPLTTAINNVTVIGADNDAVTLPAATPGQRVTIFNNDAAQTLEIWPAAGDDAGGGVDTAVTLTATHNVEFIAIDYTTWERAFYY